MLGPVEGVEPEARAPRLCGFGTASSQPGVHNLDMTVPVADRLHLNAEQRTALNLMGEGPLRLVAGPGTGKTTTVVAMYLRLLEEVGLRPSQVLLLTFANNAASDLKRRIDALHNTSYDKSWVSTFHSFATRILTTYGHLHGIVPFRLMNGFEEKVLMRRVLTQMSGLEILGPLQTSEALVQDALWFIGVLKQNLVRSDDFSGYSRVANNAKMRDLAAIYTAYWAEQDSRHLWDFRDVIAQCQLLLERNDALREELSTKFQHVIVDEYQDVDAAQVKLIAQLVEHHHPHPRLAVVGDPNQAIYSFRGTLPAFLDEKWQFGGTRVELRQNYRSYGSILAGFGSSPRPLWTQRRRARPRPRQCRCSGTASRARAECDRRGHGGGPPDRGAHCRGRRSPARATLPVTSPSSCAAFAAMAVSSKKRSVLPVFRTRWARLPTSRRPTSFGSRCTP